MFNELSSSSKPLNEHLKWLKLFALILVEPPLMTSHFLFEILLYNLFRMSCTSTIMLGSDQIIERFAYIKGSKPDYMQGSFRIKALIRVALI